VDGARAYRLIEQVIVLLQPRLLHGIRIEVRAGRRLAQVERADDGILSEVPAECPAHDGCGRTANRRTSPRSRRVGLWQPGPRFSLGTYADLWQPSALSTRCLISLWDLSARQDDKPTDSQMKAAKQVGRVMVSYTPPSTGAAQAHPLDDAAPSICATARTRSASSVL
jgi:hypothetical protein